MVRRTAEIFLFDSDDYESMFAKYGMNGLWTEDQVAQHKKVGAMLDDLGIKPVWFEQLNKIGDIREGINHRRMSNNSIAFSRKPSKDFMDFVFEMMQLEGEPGFVNLEEAARRMAASLGVENPSQKYIDSIIYNIGLNPCVEIILNSKNVCNLTTVNVKAFVKDGKLDLKGLYRAQQLSARIGLRMTLATLELPNWDAIQQRDRLLGTSLTGWKDAVDLIGYTQEQEDKLKIKLGNIAREEANTYAKHLRVNAPMFVTAVKPEGTLSQVAGGVSSGLHWSHSSYFYRRIRINSKDPLVQVAKDLGWPIHAEVGTNDIMDENLLKEQAQLDASLTWVVTFPVESGAGVTNDDINIDDQFDNYFSFQGLYTDMNTSNTISVKPGEWKRAQERVWDGWEDFVGVSFLAYDGGTYQLAPYEACTKEEYQALKDSMQPFNADLLMKYETSETEADIENMDSCEGGVCPIR